MDIGNIHGSTNHVLEYLLLLQSLQQEQASLSSLTIALKKRTLTEHAKEVKWNYDRSRCAKDRRKEMVPTYSGSTQNSGTIRA